MKKTILSFAAIMLFAASCQKEKDPPVAKFCDCKVVTGSATYYKHGAMFVLKMNCKGNDTAFVVPESQYRSMTAGQIVSSGDCVHE